MKITRIVEGPSGPQEQVLRFRDGALVWCVAGRERETGVERFGNLTGQDAAGKPVYGAPLLVPYAIFADYMVEEPRITAAHTRPTRVRVPKGVRPWRLSHGGVLYADGSWEFPEPIAVAGLYWIRYQGLRFKAYRYEHETGTLWLPAAEVIAS